jgi:hypothetical protein
MNELKEYYTVQNRPMTRNGGAIRYDERNV